MSFAAQVKKELTQIANKPCCERAELTALIQHCGTLGTDSESGGADSLHLSTENAAIARRMYTLLKPLCPQGLEVLVQRKMRLKKNNVYVIRMRRGGHDLLHSLDLLDGDGVLLQTVGVRVKGRSCCERAYLRGAFLAAGSVNDPDANSYHLELASKSRAHADALWELTQAHDLRAKVMERKRGFVLYMKEGEKIIEFLGFIGAHQALLRFEDVRIVKGMRNQVNRLVNCETANLNKTILAAVRQLDNIRLLDEELGLDQLPVKLRMVAEKRLQYPEMTLHELAQLLPDQVSKSGLNHRLRKLDEWARKVRVERGIPEPAQDDDGDSARVYN
ncbi:MAG: DNA-binding protein WhiA [Firmicutes bacterium]|nr:DNA-binding protein WhiA [Bacillota bacterium]